MIFYLAVDAEGKTKLAGNQIDAKALNKDFQQIDIPVDKTGLMAWIQQMLDETLNAPSQAMEANLQEATALMQEADAIINNEPSPETIDDVTDILYEFIGLGGGDGDTIKEYAERIAALVPEAPAAMPVAAAEPREETYAEKTLRIEDEFESLPLAFKFHLATQVMETGREILAKMEKL